jgi:hypothetical protein
MIAFGLIHNSLWYKRPEKGISGNSEGAHRNQTTKRKALQEAGSATAFLCQS